MRTCNATVVPDLENSWTDRPQTWYIYGDRLVGWSVKVNWDLPLGPTLHVRTCTVTVLDLKNGWTDCTQIWYTDRDQLVGCRKSQLETPPRSFAHAELNLSLARLPPPKSVLLVCKKMYSFLNILHHFLSVWPDLDIDPDLREPFLEHSHTFPSYENVLGEFG